MSRLRAAADPDRRARYEAVFREVYEPLQRYALRRTSPGAADDVVAEALTVLWRRLDEVPDGVALPWCYGVTRRCLANQRRGEARQQRLVDRLGAEPAAGVEGAAEYDAELDAALAELADDDRELVRLWAWEQLPPREIAVALDITANAASIRLHRAKQRLSESLARKNAAPAGHEVVGHAKEAP